MAPGAEARAEARTASAFTHPRGQRRLVLARRRTPGRAGTRGEGAPSGTFRPVGLGSIPICIVLGLDLPVRSLHAGIEAQVRLLCASTSVARSGGWLGQCFREERQAAIDVWLRSIAAAARPSVQARARCGAASHADVSGSRAVTPDAASCTMHEVTVLQ